MQFVHSFEYIILCFAVQNAHFVRLDFVEQASYPIIVIAFNILRLSQDLVKCCILSY